MKSFFASLTLYLFLIFPEVNIVCAQDAKSIVEDALDYVREETSVCELDMIIHKTDWERTMSIKAWTKKRDTSIFFITAPAKDRGSGTLKKGRQMWTYTPKINRVIKIPPSMMSQSWMGSDFSYNDISKTDSVINDYTHELIGTEMSEGHKVYVIKSVPKPEAPVVWGMQKLKIRDDHIFMQQSFYDEDLQLVKELTTRRFENMGGKIFPVEWFMRKAETPNEYTKMHYKKLIFNEHIPDRHFSVSNLKNPPR